MCKGDNLGKLFSYYLFEQYNLIVNTAGFHTEKLHIVEKEDMQIDCDHTDIQNYYSYTVIDFHITTWWKI